MKAVHWDIAEHSEENAENLDNCMTVVSREDPIKVLAIVGGNPFLTLAEGKKLGILDKFGMHIHGNWDIETMNSDLGRQDIELRQLRERVQRLEAEVQSLRSSRHGLMRSITEEEARQRREKREELALERGSMFVRDVLND
tara:strand:+ start:81 stop:503 length:423 start_codon:yes stop_codon:yes gene_type:complete